MAHEDLHPRIGVPALLLAQAVEFLAQQLVARQAERAAEAVGRERGAGEEGDGAALGEAAEEDPGRGDAGREFVGDEGVQVEAGAEDARGVVGAVEGVEGEDVVPAGHFHAAVLSGGKK